MLYWVVRGRKFYSGPLIEAEIGEDMSQQTRSSDDDDVNRKAEKYGEIVG